MTEELLRSSSNARMRRGHWAPVDSTYVGDLEGVCAARLVVRWVKGPLAQTMSGVFSTGSAGSTWLTCCEGEGPGGDRHKVRGVNQASKFGVEEEEEWAAGRGGGVLRGRARVCIKSRRLQEWVDPHAANKHAAGETGGWAKRQVFIRAFAWQWLANLRCTRRTGASCGRP